MFTIQFYSHLFVDRFSQYTSFQSSFTETRSSNEMCLLFSISEKWERKGKTYSKECTSYS